MEELDYEKTCEAESPATIANGHPMNADPPPVDEKSVSAKNSVSEEKIQACADLFMAQDESDEEDEGLPWPAWIDGDSLAPPCPSNLDVVDSLLDLASVTCSDEVVDLGAGDGRVCLRAATRFGARALGLEIEAREVEKFQRAIETLGLQDRVSVIQSDVREYDFSGVSAGTVVCLYLLPEAIQELRPKLDAALEAGARVVCNTWGLVWLEPIRTVSAGALHNADVFLYTAACLASS